MIRKRLEDTATAVVVICALAVTGMAARRQFFPPATQINGPRFIKDWRGLSTSGHRKGEANTPVTIVEFADFQCPSCERARFSLDSVIRARPSEVALVYRHYPLKMTHPFSEKAANASECAADQGRFAEISDVMFDNQASLGKLSWTTLAAKAGVADTTRFSSCLDRAQFASVVERDAAAADSVNLIGTPTLIINGSLISGALSARDLNREVDAALKRGSH